MKEPWENDQNPTLIPNPISDPKNFFQGFYLDNVPSYHPIQLPGKLMNWTWKSNKKPKFGFFVSFTSTSN